MRRVAWWLGGVVAVTCLALSAAAASAPYAPTAPPVPVGPTVSTPPPADVPGNGTTRAGQGLDDVTTQVEGALPGKVGQLVGGPGPERGAQSVPAPLAAGLQGAAGAGAIAMVLAHLGGGLEWLRMRATGTHWRMADPKAPLDWIGAHRAAHLARVEAVAALLRGKLAEGPVPVAAVAAVAVQVGAKPRLVRQAVRRLRKEGVVELAGQGKARQLRLRPGAAI